VLDRVSTLQSEMVFGDIADQIPLGQTDRCLGLKVACDVLFEGVFLAGRGDVGLGTESMFPRILADDFLTGFGGGAGGEARIRLVGGDLSWGGHFPFLLFVSKIDRAV
jgi:hypothetical protein